MSDASYISCKVSGGAATPRFLSFMTRNDWFVDALRRIGKAMPLSVPLQVLAVQSWQHEQHERYGGSYAVLKRSHDFGSADELRALVDAINDLIEWCGRHADRVARAVDGSKGEYVLEAIQARGVRSDLEKESIGGEDGEGYEFLFDALETMAALASAAAQQGQQLRYESVRSADWD